MTIKESIFKFNTSESKLLDMFAESKEWVNIADMAKKTHLPRMTCHDAVGSLLKRGILVKKNIKSKKYYTLVDEDTAINQVKSIFKTKNRAGTKSHIQKSIGDDVTILSGIDNCHAVWRKIADLKRGDRIKFIQPNSSIKETFDKLGIDALYPSNDALNDNGIISEGIIQSDCHEFVFNLLKNASGHDFAIKELGKMAKRPSDIILVDRRYFNKSTELFVIKDVVYLVNWKDEIVVEIKNKVIRDFIIELYELARGYGKKINQMDYTTAVIERMSRVS